MEVGPLPQLAVPILGGRNRKGKEVSLNAMYPHRMRLRGPWECEPIDGPPPRRVVVPCGWVEAGLAGFRGAARFSRNFGYPGKIDDTEHAWLTGDGCVGCVEVAVNSQLLMREPRDVFAFDITKLLSPRNRLEIVIRGDSDQAG